MGLLAVPGASVRRAQSGLDRNEIFKPLARVNCFCFTRLPLRGGFFAFFVRFWRFRMPLLTISNSSQAFHLRCNRGFDKRRTFNEGVRSGDRNRQPVINLQATQIAEESTLSDHKQEEAFRVMIPPLHRRRRIAQGSRRGRRAGSQAGGGKDSTGTARGGKDGGCSAFG